ncbi:putative oligonucleotidase [Helianthus annuus]|nr:putative oligonucleotidase [Helianthus annuus]
MNHAFSTSNEWCRSFHKFIMFPTVVYHLCVVDCSRQSGPDLVIHQTKDFLDEVGERCQDRHVRNGLSEKETQSTTSEKEAEELVIDFVKGHVGAYTPSLAGNSVYVDFMFLKKYMPDLASLFSHVLVDVSSVKALCCHWFPEDDKKALKSEKRHGAVLDEIKESITELKYYKEHAFRSPKSKR